VKFGQLLSVRRDLIPEDLADELAKLQDSVPPFSSGEVVESLDRAYKRPYTEVFRELNLVPIASASVAQVHFATLPDGREVAVKILRPGIRSVIAKDVSLLYTLAGLVEWAFPEGRRLRPKEVVAEFEKIIGDELDLVREAANASQLRRNFADGRLLIVPEVYWDWCNRDVMVMERIAGIPVNALEELRRAGLDIGSSPATASRSSTRRFSATASSRRHAPREHFVAKDGAIAASTSGSWERSPMRTRTTLRSSSWRSSSATTTRSRSRTSMPAGFRARRGSTSSRAPYARCASRSSTGRSRRSTSASS
jgi:hypothetical protein